MEDFPMQAVLQILSYLAAILTGWIAKHFSTKKPKE